MPVPATSRFIAHRRRLRSPAFIGEGRTLTAKPFNPIRARARSKPAPGETRGVDAGAVESSVPLASGDRDVVEPRTTPSAPAGTDTRASTSNAQTAASTTVRTDRQGDRMTLTLEGVWTLSTVSHHDRAVAGAVPDGITHLTVDGAGVTALDTAGAWVMERTLRQVRANGGSAEITGLQGDFAGLLAAVGGTDEQLDVADHRPPKLLEILNHIGASTFDLFRAGKELISFFGLILIRATRVIVNPRQIRAAALVTHMEQTGLNALPIVGLLSFLIGVVLAYQGAAQLQQFGAEIFVVNLLGVSILRELGVLLTAIIVAGRSGSAFTAEIGAMKGNQEIDAMTTLGLDPVDILVLPRVIALMITLPLLAFFASIMGLLGGGLMSWLALGVTPYAFVEQFQLSIPIANFWVGIAKAPVFAFTIAMVGCYEGMKVTGTADSVGRQTTRSVVESIFLVIVLDALFSVLFARLGI